LKILIVQGQGIAPGQRFQVRAQVLEFRHFRPADQHGNDKNPALQRK
jgi:hypothetical protein